MKIPRATAWSICIAACIAAVVGFWQWSDYARQRDALERVIVVRGRAVLSALEGGMRSHRRMGMWLRENLNAILEETVAAPGILGLAVIDKDGNHMVRGGDMPDDVRPSPAPRWTSAGVVMFRKVQFSGADEMGGGMMGGGTMRGRRWRDESGGGREEELLNDPAWLAVLLDDSECRASLAVAHRRFVVSLTIMLAAVALGVAFVTLVQRQGRLAAELGLVHERQERLEQLSLVGAGLAHETKNPLSVIRGLAQSWARHPDTPEEARADAEHIIDEADRVVGRVNSFLMYARPKSPEICTVELDTIVVETAALFEDEAAEKKIALPVSVEPCRAMADADMMRQVLVNLIVNSLAACRENDAISIELGHDENCMLTLTVNDTGDGMAAQDVALAVRPYFTKRSDGTGLGLAIVDQIVHAHGWRMDIESTEGKGTTVRIEGIEEAESV